MPGDLAQRVADLERAIYSAMQPSYTPLQGATIAADGSVTYDFDGHIHARGIDLDGQPQTLPPEQWNDFMIRWLDPAGRFIAWLRAQLPGVLSDGVIAELLSFDPDSDSARAQLRAGMTVGGPNAALWAEASNAGADTVGCAAGGQTRLILDNNGHSSFVQIEDGHSLSLVWSGGPGGGELACFVDDISVGSLFPIF